MDSAQWQPRCIRQVKMCCPARYRTIPRSSSVVTIPTELSRIPKGPKGLNAARAKQQASVDNPQPHLPSSPSPQRKVPNQKIIQQSPGHSRNCFTPNHRPVNHHIPSQQSRPTIGHLQAIIRDFRWDTDSYTLPFLSLSTGFCLGTLQPRVAHKFSGRVRIERSRERWASWDLPLCYPWCTDQWTMRNLTYLTRYDTTRSPLFFPHPAFYVSRTDVRTNCDYFPQQH
jgi:hypothetical protein